MLATCSKCGNHIDRYVEKDYKLPCENCGSVIFWVFHFGYNRPNYWVLYNVKTGEEILTGELGKVWDEWEDTDDWSGDSEDYDDWWDDWGYNDYNEAG